jgi:hypothetical protein
MANMKDTFKSACTWCRDRYVKKDDEGDRFDKFLEAIVGAIEGIERFDEAATIVELAESGHAIAEETIPDGLNAINAAATMAKVPSAAAVIARAWLGRLKESSTSDAYGNNDFMNCVENATSDYASAMSALSADYAGCLAKCRKKRGSCDCIPRTAQGWKWLVEHPDDYPRPSESQPD